MDFTTINSLNSYISGLKMQGLWHLRQQNGASHQDEITVDGVTFHRRDETLASIRAKLEAGGSLTEEERAYLRQHDPQAYQELLHAEQSEIAPLSLLDHHRLEHLDKALHALGLFVLQLLHLGIGQLPGVGDRLLRTGLHKGIPILDSRLVLRCGAGGVRLLLFRCLLRTHRCILICSIADSCNIHRTAFLSAYADSGLPSAADHLSAPGSPGRLRQPFSRL